jgi:hypothetical protein
VTEENKAIKQNWNIMNRKHILTAALLVIGAGGLIWWKMSDRPAEPVMPRAEPNISAPIASPPPGESSSDPAGSQIGWTPAPDWRERVHRIFLAEGQIGDVAFDMEIDALAREVAPEDLEAALNYLMRSGQGHKPLVSWLGLLIFNRWAERSPDKAAQWLAGMLESDFKWSAHLYLASAWGTADLPGALAWLKTLPEGPNKIDVQLSIAARAADHREAVTAVELLSVLPPGPRRDQTLGYAAQVWAGKDRETALKWLKGVENPVWREEMLGKIAIDWAVTEPQEAARFALDSMPPGQNQQNAVSTSVRNWAVLAPDQAAAWVERLSEGPLRNAAIESVAEVWAKDDPAHAADWLNSLPAGASRDAAVGMFAVTLASTSPQQAARWADTIQNESLRVSVHDQLKKQ